MRRMTMIAVLVICAGTALLCAPFIGMETISPRDLFRPGSEGFKPEIFFMIRLPRVITAFIAGAGLALSGMTFQALFRNPLATPFTLGVSSGASFGAALAMRTGIVFTFLGMSSLSLSAFMGALLSILLVYGLTRARRGFSTATMLLAGVAVSFLFSSIILFIQYMSDFTHSFRILRWLMGGLEIVGYAPLVTMLPFVIAGAAIVTLMSNELNLMMTGEDIALSRGVDVKNVKRILFFATSLMIGGIVSVCGPIGFIGMMSPHICRLLVGTDHRVLAPAAVLFGGMFLVVCDMIARTVIAPAEIPVGVITALLGGPFFLWLLLSGVSERGVFARV